jgi:putative ATPase
MVESHQLVSMILWGPAGTGKTTLARIIAAEAGFALETVSAVSSGVKDVREAIERASNRLGERGERTVLFIDEVHRFNKAQQDLLLPATESGLVVLIGATTENPHFEVNAALMSRTTLWRLNQLSDDGLNVLIDRAVALRGIHVDEEARSSLVDTANGDARAMLTTLDTAALIASGEVIGREDVAHARDGRLYHQGRDTHYDQTSAFIKSLRGSDPDAALYWMISLLEAGEDPRFIARRLVIAASEDVGLADSTALMVAESAARAVDFIGLPEAKLNLAHAAIYIALAPKSNSVTSALARVSAAVHSRGVAPVPEHLRDAHYSGAAQLGHGVGYAYPHDFARHWVAQQYLPEPLVGSSFYEPGNEGREGAIAAAWRERTAENEGDSR